MTRTSLATALVLCTASSLVAQEGGAKQLPNLQVVKQPENLLAAKIAGEWVLDGEMTRRLGGSTTVDTISIERTDEIVKGIPETLVERIAKFPISAAGKISVRGRTYPFVLLQMSGNNQLVCFRERDGKPLGDAESYIVTLASAKDTKCDLLFLGGDFATQPFSAFARSGGEPVASVKGVRGAASPEEAISQMAKLLAEGKHLEMVETFMSPADKQRILKEKKQSLEEIAEQFGNGKAKVLADLLAKLVGKRPELSEDANTAKYATGEGGRDLVLVRVDGRWYIKN